MKKLKCILLIDDDEPTNFFNQLVLNDMDCAEKIIAVQSANEGLAYLKSVEENENPRPEIIFLDINMPGMDGWDFINHYQQLEEQHKAEIVVVMLTTSFNPDDKTRALEIPEINDLLHKPLSVEAMKDLLTRHFNMPA
ncbi:response regulator [Persicobacter diffluens]|uniref:Response regulator n=1 Tax=Persicobacter diffluens TaxID=981 RepID=A0AAN4W1K9_9BACT|nr:response regulator [Persicobacter diffluens]